MPSLKDIRKRITTARSTRKITRAMKLVSAAKLKSSQGAAISARDFAAEIEELIYRISRNVGVDAPELMRRRSYPKSLDLVIISSDRGLCGGFNEVLFRRIDNVVQMHMSHGIAIELFVYGRQGISACSKKGLAIAEANEISNAPVGIDRVRGIIATLITRFLGGASDGSFIAYNQFVSAATQQVVFKDLLPFHQRRRERWYQVEYLYEPSREAILSRLIERALETLLVQAFRESHVSELAARMMAMDGATRNADDMIDHLTMLYHRARQAAITRELMDIINGAEAAPSP